MDRRRTQTVVAARTTVFYRFLPFLPLLMSAGLAQGQSLRVPADVKLGDKIVAEFQYDVPEGGKLSLLWTPSAGLATEQVGQKLFIWGPAGAHQVDLVVIPQRTVTVEGQTFDVIAGPITRYNERFTIQGTGPTPPVPPDPGPGPNPPGPLPPFPAPGLAVMLVYEAQATSSLPPAQRSILSSSEVIQYLNAKCVQLSGKPAWRFWDDDLTDGQLTNVPTILQTAYRDCLKQSSGRVPWIAISTGTTGYSGPLPDSIEQMMTLLRQFGG